MEANEIIPDPLIDSFRKNSSEEKLNIVKREWRSLVCMNCGACCCSSVIPVKSDDASRFYERGAFTVTENEFFDLFTQEGNNGVDRGDTLTIETEKYGGKCMFLSRESGSFSCAVWDVRANVCREYYCWEMTNFEKWLKGEDCDIFDPSLLKRPWKNPPSRYFLKT